MKLQVIIWFVRQQDLLFNEVRYNCSRYVVAFLNSSEPSSTWTQSIDVVCERSSKCDIISVLIKFEQPINNKELEIKKMSTES